MDKGKHDAAASAKRGDSDPNNDPMLKIQEDYSKNQFSQACQNGELDLAQVSPQFV